MICPRDHSELKRETFCGVEIDSCTRCDGTWLDKGELSSIAGMPDDLMGGKKIILEPLKDRAVGDRLKCPRHPQVDMEPYHFGLGKKLIIDRCPQCEGIWLDNDELKKVIQTAYQESQHPQ